MLFSYVQNQKKNVKLLIWDLVLFELGSQVWGLITLWFGWGFMSLQLSHADIPAKSDLWSY
jgi:hypothetical protein